MKKLLLISALVPLLLFGQTRKQRKALAAQKKADQQVIANLKSHNQFFQSKELQQQAVGNDGTTVDYISHQFKSIGLQPKGTNGYLQQFKINEGKSIDAGTFLKVNGTVLTVRRDYFPFPFSSSKQVTGMPAMALKEKGVPWFVDIKDWLEDETNKPDSLILKASVKEASRAAAKGATALFLFNSGNATITVPFYRKDTTPTVSIPVIYITSAGYKKYFSDDSQVLDIELNVAFKQVIKNATNVVGYIDKGAATNVVIAAAYDNHLAPETESMDGSKDSLNTTSDNLSSTALLIELARMLSASKTKNNNYTIVAYNAADSIASGSKWLNNTSITSQANYIVNLGTLARFDDNKTMSISTNQSSGFWTDIIRTIENSNVEVKLDSTGTRANNNYVGSVQLPVLNFYVTNNSAAFDYNKLNYEGELNIAKYIYHLIEATDSRGKIPFSAGTNAAQTSQTSVAEPVSSSKP